MLLQKCSLGALNGIGGVPIKKGCFQPLQISSSNPAAPFQPMCYRPGPIPQSQLLPLPGSRRPGSKTLCRSRWNPLSRTSEQSARRQEAEEHRPVPPHPVRSVTQGASVVCGACSVGLSSCVAYGGSASSENTVSSSSAVRCVPT